MDSDSILSTDLSGVDISRPLLQKGVVVFKVVDIKKKPNKANTGENLEISLATEFAYKSSKGHDLNPGFKHTHNIALTETEKYDKEAISRNLKQFRLAVTGDKGGTFAPLDQYIGRTVQTNVDIESDASGQYADKNVIKSWIAPKAK